MQTPSVVGNGPAVVGNAAGESTDAQTAYDRLKEMIVTLQLRPGDTIREGDLQERLGLGRTPLREALHRLAHEQMLHIYPRRAVVVAQLGVREIRQLFEMRVALETTSAGLAAQRLTGAQREALLTVGQELRQSREAALPEHFLHADQVFHRTIARYAQNTFLEATIDHILTLNLWLWHMYFDTRGVHLSDLFAHDPIIAALAAADRAAAEAAMREHILSSKEQLLTGL